jgi:Holliday junction resolvase RusA-like endonuclease
MITFTVPAVPVAQPRQRHNRQGHSYLPQDHPVWAFKAAVALAAQQAYQGPPLTEALEVKAVFVLPRPSRLCWKTKPMPRQWHTGKPDADNLTKSLFDALNGVLWRDDSQVAQAMTLKTVAAGDEAPHVEVTVAPLLP